MDFDKNNIIYFFKQLLVLVPVMYVKIQKTVHFASKNVLMVNMTIMENVSHVMKIVLEVVMGLKILLVPLDVNPVEKSLWTQISPLTNAYWPQKSVPTDIIWIGFHKKFLPLTLDWISLKTEQVVDHVIHFVKDVQIMDHIKKFAWNVFI